MSKLLDAMQAWGEACETLGRRVGEAEHEECRVCARRIRDAKIARGAAAAKLLMELQNLGLSGVPNAAARDAFQRKESSCLSFEAGAAS